MICNTVPDRKCCPLLVLWSLNIQNKYKTEREKTKDFFTLMGRGIMKIHKIAKPYIGLSLL